MQSRQCGMPSQVTIIQVLQYGFIKDCCGGSVLSIGQGIVACATNKKVKKWC